METATLAVTTPTSNERLAAFLAHAGTFVAWTIAPLLVYLVKRGESRYVEFQALQALVWSLGGTVISLATCGLAIPFFMVFHVIGAVRVANGEAYEYPIIGDFVRKLM